VHTIDVDPFRPLSVLFYLLYFLLPLLANKHIDYIFGEIDVFKGKVEVIKISSIARSTWGEVCCAWFIHWLCGYSRDKNSSPLAEFAQLPTTKLSATQPPCCFDDILEQGITAGTDVSPHACALYACHLNPEACQQQRMRGPHFLWDTDSPMWRHFHRRHVFHTFPTIDRCVTSQHVLAFLNEPDFWLFSFLF